MPSPPLWEAGLVLVGALTQPFPVGIDPEPRPVVRLIAEALGLGCEVLGLIGWNATLMDVDGRSLLEGLDVRAEISLYLFGKLGENGASRMLPNLVKVFFQ